MVPIRREDDGALTVQHDDTFASLRVVTIAEGLELVSLTQILAWDLPLDSKIRGQVAEQARDTMLGTVSLVEKNGAADASEQKAIGRRAAALQLSGQPVSRTTRCAR